MSRHFWRGAATTVVIAAMSFAAQALDGVVVDAGTGRPIADASVRVGETARHTDVQGRFSIDGEAATAVVSARAPGYLRHEVRASSPTASGKRR